MAENQAAEQQAPPKRRRRRSKAWLWAIPVAVLLCVGASLWWIVPRLHRVYLTDKGVRQVCYTVRDTVGALLGDRGVSLGTADSLTPSEETALSPDLEIVIKRSVPVYIDCGGETTLLFMTEGTVGDAMMLAGFSAEDTDSLQPAPGTPIQSGLRITWIQLRAEDTTRETAAETETIVRGDDSLPYGEVQVSAEGAAALDIVEIRSFYRDGVLLEQVLTQPTTAQAAAPRVISVGTLVTPAPTVEVTPVPTATPTPQPSASPTPKPTQKATAKPATAKPTVKVTVKPTTAATATAGTATTAPTATPAPTATKITGGTGEPSTYISTMEVSQITAYTHTGNKTATGRWPVSTRTYANPGTVAVDKSVIPYGTLLYIPGYGYALAEDAGPTGTHLDVFMDTEAECVQWGRKRNKTVYIVETGYSR